MSEHEQFIVHSNEVVVENLFPEDLEPVGTHPWPCARSAGKLYAYRYTSGDIETAKGVVFKQKNPKEYVIGVAINLGQFLETGEVEFDDQGIGIWKQIEDVPEAFKDAINGIEGDL